MSTPTDLEDRLRAGLHSAAEALPPRPVRNEHRLRVVESPGRRRWGRPILATAAALATVAGITAVVLRDSGSETTDDVTVATAPTTTAPATTTPSTTVVARITNGAAPGQAVVQDDQLRTFGPNGEPTGTIDVSPMWSVQAAASDLNGGWVVCGMDDDRGGRMAWHPASGPPVVLLPVDCTSGSLQVVDSPEGPVAVYAAFLGGLTGGDPEGGPPPFLTGVVLATQEVRPYPISFTHPDVPLQWSVTTDRLLTYRDGAGFQMFDLATGAELPMPDVDLPSSMPPSELALAPDGKSAAVLMAHAAEPPNMLFVFDVATGAERYRREFPMPAEGDEMSYDGAKVSVGNYYDGYMPVTVIDLPTGAEHTIDAHGVVL